MRQIIRDLQEHTTYSKNFDIQDVRIFDDVKGYKDSEHCYIIHIALAKGNQKCIYLAKFIRVYAKRVYTQDDFSKLISIYAENYRVVEACIDEIEK